MLFPLSSRLLPFEAPEVVWVVAEAVQRRLARFRRRWLIDGRSVYVGHGLCE